MRTTGEIAGDGGREPSGTGSSTRFRQFSEKPRALPQIVGIAAETVRRRVRGSRTAVMTVVERRALEGVVSGTEDLEHSVYFYDSDDDLCQRVAELLHAGLAAEDAVLVIATEAHAEKIRDSLRARGF